MFNKRIALLLVIPLFMVFTISLGVTTSVKAVEFDDDGIVEAGEVIDDDLFIGSETVEINGTVNGDVFATGSVVIINGTIHGSLATGATSIVVNGTIDGSIYAGSYTMTLGNEAQVGRNMYYGGFNLTTEPGSYINKDLLVGAYQALLSGEIARDVRAGVGALEINGVVGNDVIADVGSPADTQQTFFFDFLDDGPDVEIVSFGLRVSEDAVIGGSLKYKSSQDQSDAIKISPPGGITYEYEPEFDPQADVDEASRVGTTALIASWVLKQIRLFITLILLGGLVVWQLPGLVKQVGDKIERESMPSLGWGMLSILVVYIGAVLVSGLIIAGAIFFGVITLGELSQVILSVGFSSMGLILAGFGLLVSYGSKLVVAYLVGRLLLRWLAPQYEDKIIWPMLLGVFLYSLLRAIPIFGDVLGVFVTFIGLGAIYLTLREKFSTQATNA